MALMLVATAAWGQAHRPATGAFRVSWDLETDPVDRRIEGRVHNDDREQHTRHRGHLAHLSPAPRESSARSGTDRSGARRRLATDGGPNIRAS